MGSGAAGQLMSQGRNIISIPEFCRQTFCQDRHKSVNTGKNKNIEEVQVRTEQKSPRGKKSKK